MYFTRKTDNCWGLDEQKESDCWGGFKWCGNLFKTRKVKDVAPNKPATPVVPISILPLNSNT